MRIITNKPLYRAFPELDKFSDDQCRRFVKSANRSFFRIWLRRLLLTITGFCVFMLLQYPGALLTDYLLPINNISTNIVAHFAVFTTSIIIAVFLGFFVALLLRDLLLRKRIRYVIRTRGICSQCHYLLLGLVVGPDLNITCPECGLQTKADPSLGELSTQPSGTHIFSPAPPPRKIRKPWLSRRMKTIIRRFLTYSSLAVFLILLIIEITWWIQTSIDKRAAAAVPDPLPQFIKWIEEAQPEGSSSDENYYAELVAIKDDSNKIMLAVSKEWDERVPRSSSYSFFSADISILSKSAAYYANKSTNENQKAFEQQEYLAAQEAFHRIVSNDIFHRLDNVFLNQRFVPSIEADIPDYLGTFRTISRLLVARSAIAYRNLDLDEFRKASDGIIKLLSISNRQPALLAGLFHQGILAQHFNMWREIVLNPPNIDWLITVEKTSNSVQSLSLNPHYIESERLYARYSLAKTFREANPNFAGEFWNLAKEAEWSNIWQDFSFDLDLKYRYFAFLRRGRYQAAIDQLNTYYDLLNSEADKPAALRDPIKLTKSLTMPVVLECACSNYVFMIHDGDKLYIPGLRLLIAITKYHTDLGTYPSSLDALVPTYLPLIPLDPYSGQPFKYKLIDPASDPHHRSFLLYSVGPDLNDDGSNDSNLSLYQVLHSTTKGVDAVINQPVE